MRDAVLQTDRLELRRPVEADRAVFGRLFGDDDFMVFSGGALEPEAAGARFDVMLRNAGEVPFAKQPIIERSTGQIIGYSGVAWFEFEGTRRLEYGWRLVPDSRGVGYATEAGVPYRRPFVKYTPTWPRSFMPQDQSVRNLVANMKLIPINEIMDSGRVLFCEDSIVRGTQLQDIVKRVFDHGAAEVHMRPACPPLIHGCKFLNFSRSRSELELAGRRAVHDIEGDNPDNLDKYADPDTDEYAAMVERIRERLGLTTLRYQRLDDLVDAIGLPKEKLCTYCWDKAE